MRMEIKSMALFLHESELKQLNEENSFHTTTQIFGEPVGVHIYILYDNKEQKKDAVQG